MKYKNFEDLPVWKDAISFASKVFNITQAPSFKGKGDLANQLQRASLSISNNLAEGFERGTTPDLLKFIYIAKGSAGEVRSMLYLIDHMKDFNSLSSEISQLKPTILSISKQLGGWALSLQESNIPGTRHLTEKSKNQFHQKNKADSLMGELKDKHEARLKELNKNR